MKKACTAILAILAILFLLLIVGCNFQKKVSNKIIDTIEKQNGACVIDMKDIVTFEWDKMVIFEPACSQGEVEKALGVDIEGFKEGSGFVFSHQNRVVYKEFFPYNPEKPELLQIRITSTLIGIQTITPQNAKFNAEKYYLGKEPRYFITQIKSF